MKVKRRDQLADPFSEIDIEFKRLTDEFEAKRKAAQPKKALRIVQKIEIVKKESAG